MNATPSTPVQLALSTQHTSRCRHQWSSASARLVTAARPAPHHVSHALREPSPKVGPLRTASRVPSDTRVRPALAAYMSVSGHHRRALSASGRPMMPCRRINVLATLALEVRLGKESSGSSNCSSWLLALLLTAERHSVAVLLQGPSSPQPNPQRASSCCIEFKCSVVTLLNSNLLFCAGGNKDYEPCDICPVGTFSPGFTRDRCIPCGFGYTSPIGSKQERDCYPVDQCPAGTGAALLPYVSKLHTVFCCSLMRNNKTYAGKFHLCADGMGALLLAVLTSQSNCVTTCANKHR
jgi:hypothetical protein